MDLRARDSETETMAVKFKLDILGLSYYDSERPNVG